MFPGTDPWSSESSGAYETLQIIPGPSSFDWGEPLELGADSGGFLHPSVLPTSAEKRVRLCSWGLCRSSEIHLCVFIQVISQIVTSMWRPWNYLVGTGEGEGTGAAGGPEAEMDPDRSDTESDSPTAASGGWKRVTRVIITKNDG